MLGKRHLFRPLFLSTFVLLLFLLLAQLILVTISYIFPQVQVVDWGTVEHGQWVKVLAIREEKVFTVPFNAELNLLVDEGARVRVGDAVAEVIKTENKSSLNQDQRLALRTIAGRLERIEQEVSQLEKDLAYLQSQTRDPAGTKEQLQKTRSAKESLLRTRTHLIVTGDSYFSSWTEYYQLVVADQPGIFSTRLDGGEELDVLGAHGPNKDPFTQSFKANQNFSKKIKAGNPWGKIIGDYCQTLICRLPAGVNLEPPEGATLLVDGERFPLSFIATDYTNRHWFFTENSLSPTLLNQRIFSGYLIYKYSTGLRVPAAALNYHEQAGWTVTTSIKGNRSQLGVDVIDQNDQWAIVEGLPIGTTVFYR